MRALGRIFSTTAVASILAAMTATAAVAAPHKPPPRQPPPPPPLPMTVRMEVINGRCDSTVLRAYPGADLTVQVDTASNYRSDSAFRIWSRGIQMPLPIGMYMTSTYVHVGPLNRGVTPFEVFTPAWSGSSGDGCQGIIQVG